MLQPLQNQFESLNPEYKICVVELLSALHSNLAATNLSLREWDAAIHHSNEVRISLFKTFTSLLIFLLTLLKIEEIEYFFSPKALKLKENAVKPLIRRAEAYTAKNDFERARNDLQTAESLLNSTSSSTSNSNSNPNSSSLSLLSNDPNSLRPLLERAKKQLKLKEQQYEEESKKIYSKMFTSHSDK